MKQGSLTKSHRIVTNGILSFAWERIQEGKNFLKSLASKPQELMLRNRRRKLNQATRRNIFRANLGANIELLEGRAMMATDSITALNTAFTEDFDGMLATTTLPTGYKMHASTASPTYGGAAATVTQQASSGSPTAGGTYNFGSTASERAVGAMTSGSFASPNNLLAQMTNNTGSAITSLTVGFDVERYRINTAAASVQFFVSTNGTAWTAVTAGDVATTSFATGTSAYNFASGTTVNRTGVSIAGLNVANGSNVFLRWNINTTGGSSQGIAIDNISVTASGNVVLAAPTVTSQTATLVTSSSATLNGNVTADGGSALTDRGFVYSLSSEAADPIIGGPGVLQVINAGQTGAFSSNIIGLTGGSSYKTRAYAINAQGTTYSNVVSFTTATPSVVVVQSGDNTSLTEGGATDTYTLALATAPAGNVSITVNADLQTEVSTDGVSFFSSVVLTFNSTAAQTVTARALNDTVVEGAHTGTITHSITTTADSTNYPTSLAIASVTANITDNDFVSLVAPQSNNFETVAGPAGLGLGWTVASVDADLVNTWAAGSITTPSADRFAAVNGFGDTAPANDWLISPPINLDATASETVTFETWTQFTDNGVTAPAVKFRYSTNYTGSGSPALATWTDLAYTFPAANSQVFTPSGNVDVSGITGTQVWFAFQYQSSGTAANTTTSWRVDDFSIAIVNPDLTPPTVVTLSPSDGSTAVPVNANLVLTFDEPIAKGTGNIEIRRVDDNSIVQTIAVGNSAVTVAGAVATINPADLPSLTALYVTVGAGAFTDTAAALNPFGGINGSTAWDFTTVAVDTTAPTVVSLSPADDATGVAASANLLITFSEPIAKGTGSIEIRLVSDNTVVQTIAVSDAAVTVSGAVATINPPANLAFGTAFYVIVPAGAFTDTAPALNPFAGITSPTGWNFTTFALPNVWINELNYDPLGTDSGEFVEVAGPAGADLSGFSIVLYNGANGQTYASSTASSTTLSGLIDNEGGTGFGALSFLIPGLQNGAPDGLALVFDGTVVLEFISYEGSFAAVNGPANGMSSTDIGASQSGDQAIGFTLQRNNSVPGIPGAWVGPVANSPGSLNLANPTIAVTAPDATYTGVAYVGAGSTVTGAGLPAPVVSFTYYAGATATGQPVVPINVGQYTVVSTSPANGGNNAATSAPVTFNITPASLTIQGGGTASKVYGTTAELGISIGGLLASDSITGFTVVSDGSGPTATVAGSPYAITPSAATGPGLSNYTISYVEGSLTVTPRAVTITADAKSKTVGQVDPPLTFVESGLGLVNSDTVTLTRASGETVGTYPITIGSFPASANYDVTYVGANLTINPAPVAPTFAGAAVNGGDSFLNAAQRSQLTSLVLNFSAPVNVTSDAFTISNVGLVTAAQTATVLVNSGIGNQILIDGNGSSTITLRWGAGTGVVTRGVSGVTGNSLADGNWQLSIDSSKVIAVTGGLSLTGQNQFGATSADNFFRMFGDSDGNGVVNSLDSAAFARATIAIAYNAAMDFDGSGSVVNSGVDRSGFLSSFSSYSGKRRRLFGNVS